MIKLKGIAIDNFVNLDDHQWVEDFIYYDGPLLSLFVNKENADYQFLYFWVDADEEYNRWLIFGIDIDNLDKYLNGEISLKNLILIRAKNNCYVFYENNEYDKNIMIVEKDNFPKEYLPSDDSFYDISLNTLK